jgi:hypothetical protein
MTLDRVLGIAAGVLALTVGMARPGVCAGPPARRADAHKLVRIAEDACASAVRALQAPDLRGSRSEPLRSALLRMESSLAEIQARLEERDLRFFQMLSTGSRTLAEVSVVWPRSGLQDPVVDREIRSLSAAYGRLRNRYGDEWLRFQAGPTAGQTLSADEKRRFQALQAMEAAFASRLAVLIEKLQAAGNAGNAGNAGDIATVRDLSLLMSQANRIAQAPATLDEMLNAEVVADAIQGEYDAVRDANPADDAEWNGADQVAEDLRTDPSVGFVFSVDLQTAKQWSYTRVETDVPDEVADADIPADRPPALDEVLAAGRTTAVPVLVASSEPEAANAANSANNADTDDPEAMEDMEVAEPAEAGVEEPAVPAAPETVAKAAKDSEAPTVLPAVDPQKLAKPSMLKPPMRSFLL